MRAKAIRKFLKAVALVCQPEGVTIDEITESLGFNKRSAYRVPKTLESVGVPIHKYQDDEGKQRYTVDDAYKKEFNRRISLPLLKLSESELVSLYSIRGNDRLVRGLTIGQEIKAAFDKLDELFPGKAVRRLERIQRLFLPPLSATKNYDNKTLVLDRLMKAALDEWGVRVTYHRFQPTEKTSVFDADPLHFFECDGGLYLIYRYPKTGGIRTLAVDRIQDVEITDRAFLPPKDFVAEKYLTSPFDITKGKPFHARIRFSAKEATFIRERNWHPTQKITEFPDGSILFEMTATGSWEVKRWVLGYGAEAEVMAPKELRDVVAEDVRRLHGVYGKQLGKNSSQRKQ
jgi:predicted DNA-binding transcriptional regulator YafY